MRYTEYNVGKAREELVGKKVRFKIKDSKIIEWKILSKGLSLLVKDDLLVTQSERDENNISYIERIEILEEEPKEWDYVYVSDESVEDALRKKEKRILITAIPWDTKYKYICVVDWNEDLYNDQKSYRWVHRRYIAPIPKEEQEEQEEIVTIELKWKKYKAKLLEEI